MLAIFKKFILSVCLLALSGCGFHLRGDMPLAPPLKRLYLETKDPYGQLTRNLKQYLKMSGVYLTSSPADADAILVIQNEVEGQQLQSISGTQQTRQYNLTLTVLFNVSDPNGAALTGQKSVVESRPLTIQSNQILGGSNEQANLYKQMRLAIVFDIMSVLSSQDVTDILNKLPTKKH